MGFGVCTSYFSVRTQLPSAHANDKYSNVQEGVISERHRKPVKNVTRNCSSGNSFLFRKLDRPVLSVLFFRFVVLQFVEGKVLVNFTLCNYDIVVVMSSWPVRCSR